MNDVGINFIILDKAPRLGGTWWYNSYPGVACDIPSHLYSFSFFKNPNWSKEYSPGSEILNYLEQVKVCRDEILLKDHELLLNNW